MSMVVSVRMRFPLSVFAFSIVVSEECSVTSGASDFNVRVTHRLAVDALLGGLIGCG